MRGLGDRGQLFFFLVGGGGVSWGTGMGEWSGGFSNTRFNNILTFF